MAFVKAKREQIWLKILLTSPSGGGKSYSALRIATGLAKKCNSNIAYIGTEGSRDKYYSNEYEYDLLQLEEPFSIKSYLEAVDEAIEAGYKVLIIDSLSHEWKWLNDKHDKMPGNSFQNWGKLKPEHNKFMDTLLNAPIHIIATARAKDDWVMETVDGKQVPKKVGLGAVQDKETTYNYTVSFMLEQGTHIATSDKDNTHLFEDRYEVLTEKDGERLYDWANDSDIPATVRKVVDHVAEDNKKEELVNSIKDNFMALDDADKKKEFKALMKELGLTNFKPESIEEVDVDSLKKLLEYFS